MSDEIIRKKAVSFLVAGWMFLPVSLIFFPSWGIFVTLYHTMFLTWPVVQLAGSVLCHKAFKLLKRIPKENRTAGDKAAMVLCVLYIIFAVAVFIAVQACVIWMASILADGFSHMMPDFT